jgi:hypothetical protein
MTCNHAAVALQEQAVAKEALQLQLHTTTSERDSLASEACGLKSRLAELVAVQTQLTELQVQHETASARVAELEEEQKVRGDRAKRDGGCWVVPGLLLTVC